MEGEKIKFPPSGYKLKPIPGSAGLKTQVPGAAATVSNLANATGGITPGKIAERETK